MKKYYYLIIFVLSLVISVFSAKTAWADPKFRRPVNVLSTPIYYNYYL